MLRMIDVSLGRIMTGLTDEKGELSCIMPEDVIFFQRNKSCGKEMWTYGFFRNCKKLYFLDGGNKQTLAPNNIIYEDRRFFVEMLCGLLGYDFEEMPPSYNIPIYRFTARKKPP